MVGTYLERRRIAGGTLALAAFLTGTLTAISPGGIQALADSGQTSTVAPNTGAALHDAMRRLWEQHVTWTRLAVVEFAAGSTGFDATATRLLRNQTDIGDAVKPFFGVAAGDKLASSLHDHITIAVEILQAAKAGNTAALKDATARWYANANDIADFLAGLNPRYWPQARMRNLMKVHLDQTLAEAKDTLQSRFAASVKDYEQIETHILRMADILSNGIIAAFPEKFHFAAIPSQGDQKRFRFST